MFVPISDDNPLRRVGFAWVTIALIVVNIVIFGLEFTPQGQHYAASFAIVPSELYKVGMFGGSARGPFDIIAVPEWMTLVSYMYLHGDFMHLTANMLFLWVFGDNVEDAMGHGRFLLFYTLCGVAGALAHAFMGPASSIPLIGASGAVAGCLAAYLMLHPHVRVWVLAFRVIPLRITASFALGAWILTQLVMIVMQSCGDQLKLGRCVWRAVGGQMPPGAGDGVAWWAHVGGLVAGAQLVARMKHRDVPQFDRPPPAAA